MPLDIGVGILLSIGVAEWFNVPLFPAFVLFGILSALVPDIDIVTALFGKWHHRTYTHYPLLSIPLFLLAYLLLPAALATLFTLGVLAHLVHDTIGTGWGISWGWPFSTRRYLFFPEGKRRKEMGTVASWLPEDKPQYAHSDTNNNWVRNLYFRPNPVAYIEYGFFVFALFVLWLYEVL